MIQYVMSPVNGKLDTENMLMLNRRYEETGERELELITELSRRTFHQCLNVFDGQELLFGMKRQALQ